MSVTSSSCTQNLNEARPLFLLPSTHILVTIQMEKIHGSPKLKKKSTIYMKKKTRRILLHQGIEKRKRGH